MFTSKQSWENNVRRISPYTPGEQPKDTEVIKLNTNENPYPPSPYVQKAIAELNSEKMKLYPDTDSTELVEELAKRYNLKPNQIFIGVGSDDVISMVFLTFFNSKKPIFFPDVTYSFYDVWAKVYSIPLQKQPLNDRLQINKADYIGKENGGIIFPNPNAPTGIYESVELIDEIAAANPDVAVIIDEAYIDFGGESCLKLIDKYENLLIVQTFSKSRAMAGMRIGFAMGSEKMIKYLNDVKFSINSYTMNYASQVCGAASVKDEEYFKQSIEKIIETREYTKKKLFELGFISTDSLSNFVFVTHKSLLASYIFDELKKKRIYVRYFKLPRIDNYLRISIGTRQQMDSLLFALSEIVNNKEEV